MDKSSSIESLPSIKTEAADIKLEDGYPSDPAIGIVSEPLPSTSSVFCAVKQEPLVDLPFENMGLSEDELVNTENNDVNASSPLPAFVCLHCGYRPDGRSALRAHIVEEHPEVIHQTGQISSRFTEITEISKERPHSCPHCEYKAIQSSHLKTHIKFKHTGERPYSCPHCEYKAAQSGHLKTHIKFKHTGEMPFSCPECGYRSAHSGALKRHIISKHTGERPYSCPHCEYISAQSGHLKTHIISKHTDRRPFSCPYCQYKSAQSGHLKRHLKAKHIES